jgi:hypothetical protein
MYGSQFGVTAVALMALLPVSGVAADAEPAPADTTAEALPSIVVTAKRLNEARSSIQTQTGASTYTIDAAAIAATPGGDNSLLNQVIMQAPDVAQDSFGQFHIRGEHNGLQYRLNGIILPEGISVFGQTLDPRLIDSVSLITGALPAEYGLRTAGIIDLKTKSGLVDSGGSVALYGGSHGTFAPSAYYASSAGNLSYFVSVDALRNDVGIESPDGSADPIHDRTTQFHGFGYLEDILNEENRLTLLVGSSDGRFQIPNRADLEPGLALTVDGQTMFPSAALNENQREITQFSALGWQHSAGALDVQTSFIGRYSSLNFSPDPLGDLLFTGIAQDASKQNTAYALQSDVAYKLTDSHTVRSGVYVQTDRSVSATTSQVLATNSAGIPLSDTPISIQDNSAQTEWIESAYLQDEWKALPSLVLNYGLRFDTFSAYTSASQLSPRLNAVWQALPATTVHAGYSRYLSPPPFELVGSKTVAQFTDTTAPPLSPLDASPLPERANYYDVGVQQKISRALSVGVDTYYKQSRNLIDEGQFGAPIILTPFNYRYGKQYGAELTTNYSYGHLTAYLNLAAESAKGKEIDTAQFNFDTPDLAYIANNYIHLDHEQQKTASGGLSYRWRSTRVSTDFLLGSGLRADLELPAGVTTPYGGTGIPNGAHLPYYMQVNLGVTHEFEIRNSGDWTARFDIINVFDEVYEIRNGTGVGVGAPQFGPRRGLFVGLAKAL